MESTIKFISYFTLDYWYQNSQNSNFSAQSVMIFKSKSLQLCNSFMGEVKSMEAELYTCCNLSLDYWYQMVEITFSAHSVIIFKSQVFFQLCDLFLGGVKSMEF